MAEKPSQEVESKSGLWEWVKALSTLCIVFVISQKIYLTPIALTIDFPTLLSLILALFSVALSALFYFKATDTSNTFYDNTYKFTKDIAQLLVKIESGFGERLRNLDEGYTSMRNYLQHSSDQPNNNVENTKQKIEIEKGEMEKVVQERNEIIKNLIEQSTLQEEEKTKVINTLKEKETELSEAQNELSKMNKRLFVERINRKRINEMELDINNGLAEFTRSHVVRKIGAERILEAPRSYLIKRFDREINELPRGYIQDLEDEGYFDNGLTDKGHKFLCALAKREIA